MFFGWMSHIQNFSCTYGIKCDCVCYIDNKTYIAFAEITFTECHIEADVKLISVGDTNENNASTFKININNCRIYSSNNKEKPLIVGGRINFNSADMLGDIWVDCTTVLSNNSNCTIYNLNVENNSRYINSPFTSHKKLL